MSLRSPDYLATLDRTKTALGILDGLNTGLRNHRTISLGLGHRAISLGHRVLGLTRKNLRSLDYRLLFVGAGDLGSGDDTSRRCADGEPLDEVFDFAALQVISRLIAFESRWIVSALGRSHDVHGRTNENECRGEGVNPNTGHQGRGIAAHQLDPEPPDAVSRDIRREQPTMPDSESAVDQDQHRENQEIPEQLIQEGRMDHFDQLAGRHPVQRIECTAGIASLVNLETPRQSRRATIELLIEVIAQAADCLGKNDSRRDRVPERGQRYPTSTAGNPGTDTTEGDCAPNSKAAIPYP